MNERDELARTIEDVDIANEWDPSPGMYLKYGDAILAAGYRKPRTITTAEELDALPVDSVVRTSNGHVYEKGCFPDDEEFPFWAATGEPRVFPGRRVPLPATVLWEPR